MKNKNQFFAVQAYVAQFKDAQFRTLCRYETMIGKFSVIIPLLSLICMIGGFILFSGQLLLSGIGIGVALFIYNGFIHYTKLGWAIRKSIIYFIFEFKIDLEVDKMKSVARDQLREFRDVISEMEKEYEPAWKNAGKDAQGIVDYSIQ